MKKNILYFIGSFVFILTLSIALTANFSFYPEQSKTEFSVKLIETANAKQTCSRTVSIKVLGTGIEHSCSISCGEGETAKCGLFRCRCV